MTDRDLTFLKQWFSDYTRSFRSENEEDQKNITIKIEHTCNVCGNIVDIATRSDLQSSIVRLAETVALFHDLGRFPQYRQYRTFRDADSMNHGLLGAKTLVEEDVLSRLPEKERGLIIQAVKFHNAFVIPTVFNGDVVLLLKLIRDADKIDIFRVFIHYYDSPEDMRASATAFGVPDTPEYSPVMLSSLQQGKVAAYSDIKTENDFKLMKLSWVYDMHFDESLRILAKRGYINNIIERLPDRDEIHAATGHLKEYMSQRLNNGQ